MQGTLIMEERPRGITGIPKELESAYNQGLKVKAELRFLIEKGMTSVKVPEDVIMNRVKFQPVFDLRTGRRLTPAATTE